MATAALGTSSGPPQHGAHETAAKPSGRPGAVGLAELLTSRGFHVAVIVLVLCDLAITITSLGLSLSHCTLSTSRDVVWALRAITIASVCILAAFLIEFAVSLWAFGVSWLGNVAHVADVVVVAIALAADSWELQHGVSEDKGNVEEIVALVVFARTWRVVRVIRSVLDAEGEVHRPGPHGHRPGPGVPPHPCLVPQPSGYHNVLAPGVRARVRHWMRHRRFHQCVLGLVAADLALTAAALGVTVTHCQLEHVPEVVEHAMTGLEYASIAILCVFQLEFLTCLWTFGLGWLTSAGHVVDVVVVTVSLVLDCVEKGMHHAEGVQEVVALIIMGRLWRLAHVVHSTAEAVEEGVEIGHESSSRAPHGGHYYGTQAGHRPHGDSGLDATTASPSAVQPLLFGIAQLEVPASGTPGDVRDAGTGNLKSSPGPVLEHHWQHHDELPVRTSDLPVDATRCGPTNTGTLSVPSQAPIQVGTASASAAQFARHSAGGGTVVAV